MLADGGVVDTVLRLLPRGWSGTLKAATLESSTSVSSLGGPWDTKDSSSSVPSLKMVDASVSTYVDSLSASLRTEGAKPPSPVCPVWPTYPACCPVCPPPRPPLLWPPPATPAWRWADAPPAGAPALSSFSDARLMLLAVSLAVEARAERRPSAGAESASQWARRRQRTTRRGPFPSRTHPALSSGGSSPNSGVGKSVRRLSVIEKRSVC